MQSIPAIDITKANQVNPAELLSAADEGFAQTFRTVVERIKRVRRTSQVRIATSHGKDSTLLLNAALQAHIELAASGEIDPAAPFICTNIDTKVDDIYVRAQIIREVKELKRYCSEKQVNLEYLTATPPARYSWAVMYASGAKLPSFVKLSADCSIILKIDPAKRLERELLARTGENLVTLLGSRSEESARRASSIKRHSNTVEEIEIHGGENGAPRTCAPMADLTDGDVFGILRRMGTDPIVKTEQFIPSYAPHHKLIIKLYGDAQETCPVTSFADAAVPKNGSCGASRFGCTLCLKVTKDKSATARSASAQYAAASNVLAIRDYLAHHAEDMSLREPLAKSVCELTNTLVIQENTYNAQTLEKLIYWLCQATRDDYLRAKKFRAVVDAGRVNEDPGYQEIMRDESLSADDKAYFAGFYIESHKRHMLQLIDLEQIMLICAIHARDGVKLPPFHALWIYNEVQEGRYIPYPTVTGEMKQDPVPEPRFADVAVPRTVKMHLGEVLLDSELSCGHDVNNLKTDKVEVASLLCTTPLKRQLKHSFTKRKVTKLRKEKGQIAYVERGRMGVLFGAVSDKALLAHKHERAITLEKGSVQATEIDTAKMLGIIASVDPIPGGMSINTGESLYWFIEMELDRILARHKQFVESQGRYAFGGIQPFQKMLSFGVLELTEKAMRNCDLLLMRTDMLHQAGLYSLSPSELKAVSLSQEQYRSMRAKRLLAVRSERNNSRTETKAQLTLLNNSPAKYIERYAMDSLVELVPAVKSLSLEATLLTSLIHSQGNTTFDGVSLMDRRGLACRNLSALNLVYSSTDKLIRRLGIENASNDVTKAAAKVVAKYNALKREALKEAPGMIKALQASPTKASSVVQMLVAHSECKACKVVMSDAAKAIGVTDRNEFQETYKNPKTRQLSRMSFLSA